MSNHKKMKIGVLGSTGSIGTQTLSIVRENPDQYEVVLLSAHSSLDLLSKQVSEFHPSHVAVTNEKVASRLNNDSSYSLHSGQSGLIEVIRNLELDCLVVGIIGFAALNPVLEAIKANIHIALANKEVLVAASSLVRTALSESSSVLVPVDSEHNSLFQCLLGRDTKELSRVIITASGGPFLNSAKEELKLVTPEQACKHPNWSMGKKISIDSATLMNKGLEVIEAAALFDLELQKIEVLVHPQSIVHGLVEYYEGTSIAALYHPNMCIPIAFSLDYIYQAIHGGKTCSKTNAKPLDLASLRNLEFFTPDLERFPCLDLAYQALERGMSAPAILNAANELAVDSFSNYKIKFMQIPEIIENTLNKVDIVALNSVEDIIKIDSRAREIASEYISNYS